MELYKKIQPLEDEISDLKETYTEKLAGKKTTHVIHVNMRLPKYCFYWFISRVSKSFSELTNRLNVTQKELQESEQLLKQSDSKNYELSMNTYHWGIPASVFYDTMTPWMFVYPLVMKITELRSQLKEAKEKGSKDAEKDTAGLILFNTSIKTLKMF